MHLLEIDLHLPDLVKPESSTLKALGSELFGNIVQVEDSLLYLLDAVVWGAGWQFFSTKVLVRSFNHTLSMIITQLNAGTDDSSAKPLTQDLQSTDKTILSKKPYSKKVIILRQGCLR